MPRYHPEAVLRYHAHVVKPANEVERADRHTSLADARAGICLAAGVALDDIDPASGYDISEQAYRRVRQSWVTTIMLHGWSGECRPESELPGVLASWTRRRPDLTAADSADAWLRDGASAHRQYWDGVIRVCNRPGCILHDDTVQQPVVP